MTKDVRASLDRLVAALETHFAAAQGKRGEFDSAVETAYSRLADAFDEYDDALFQRYDETTPLALYDDDDFDFVDEDSADLDGDDDEDDLSDFDGDNAVAGAHFDAATDPVEDTWIDIADSREAPTG